MKAECGHFLCRGKEAGPDNVGHSSSKAEVIKAHEGGEAEVGGPPPQVEGGVACQGTDRVAQTGQGDVHV